MATFDRSKSCFDGGRLYRQSAETASYVIANLGSDHDWFTPAISEFTGGNLAIEIDGLEAISKPLQA